MKTGKNRVFLKKVEFFLFLISEFQAGWVIGIVKSIDKGRKGGRCSPITPFCISLLQRELHLKRQQSEVPQI